MLKGIKQTDEELLPVIRKYGCLFLCFAYASPLLFEGKVGRYALNGLFIEAIFKGIISDDINHDGDYDDIGEAEVQDHNALARLFNLKVKYDGIHHTADEKIPSNVAIVFGQYYWKSGHFVVLNNSKKVSFDSCESSNTVKNGQLKSMRFYYAG